MKEPISEVFNVDCMEYMKTIPDKFFDLAVIDPPYGIADNPSRHKGNGTLRNRFLNKNADTFAKWDVLPAKEYFDELFRVSKNQIIWGGNYFKLDRCRCFVIWDKEQPFQNFSACEYAWTSFNLPAKIYKEATTRTGEKKIHPTQKSVKLYRYLLSEFTKQGDKIFDSHMGSQSSRIAAYQLGFDYYGCEIDENYFSSGNERFERECQGITTMKDGRRLTQTKLPF